MFFGVISLADLSKSARRIWQLNIDNRIEGTQDVRICEAARKIRQDMPALFKQGDNEEMRF